MKQFYFLISMLSLELNLLAQHPPEWSTNPTDNYQSGSMMTKDQEGNILMTSYRSSFIGDADIFTYKYNPQGELLWQVQDSTGIPGVYQKSRWINTDSNNNVYVTGYVYAGTSSEYTSEIVVLKYDPMGQLIWKKKIGNIFPSALNLRSEIDASNRLCIGTVSVAPGFRLLKLDTNGDVLVDVSDASSENQNFDSMRLKGDRIAMSSYAGNGFQASVAVFDTSGNILWSEHFESDGAPDLEMDEENQVYVLSRETNLVSSTSNYDFQISKFNATGDLIDTFHFDFGLSNDFPSKLVLSGSRLTAIGSTIAQNEAYMDWVIMQCDLEGNLLWWTTYDEVNANDEKPRWLTVLDNGTAFVSGQGGPGYNQFGNTYLQYVTAKYQNGSLIWSDVHPYQGYIGIVNMADEMCGLYVLGETSAVIHHYDDDCLMDDIQESNAYQEAPYFQVFPNPASDQINIQMVSSQNSIQDMMIYDMSGRKVLMLPQQAIQTGSNHFEVSTSSLKPGVYSVSIGTQTMALVIF